MFRSSEPPRIGWGKDSHKRNRPVTLRYDSVARSKLNTRSKSEQYRRMIALKRQEEKGGEIRTDGCKRPLKCWGCGGGRKPDDDKLHQVGRCQHTRSQ